MTILLFLIAFLFFTSNKSTLPLNPILGITGMDFNTELSTIESTPTECIVQTVDGTLYKLDIKTGEVLWESNCFASSPLVSSSNYTDNRFILPSTTGMLYLFSENSSSFERLPINVQQLVELSPFKAEDGTLYVSSKTSSLVSIDLNTGIVIKNGNKNKDTIVEQFVRVDYFIQGMNKDAETQFSIHYSEIHPFSTRQEDEEMIYYSSFEDDFLIFTTSEKRLYLQSHSTLFSIKFESQPISLYVFDKSKWVKMGLPVMVIGENYAISKDNSDSTLIYVTSLYDGKEEEKYEDLNEKKEEGFFAIEIPENFNKFYTKRDLMNENLLEDVPSIMDGPGGEYEVLDSESYGMIHTKSTSTNLVEMNSKNREYSGETGKQFFGIHTLEPFQSFECLNEDIVVWIKMMQYNFKSLVETKLAIEEKRTDRNIDDGLNNVDVSFRIDFNLNYVLIGFLILVIVSLLFYILKREKIEKIRKTSKENENNNNNVNSEKEEEIPLENGEKEIKKMIEHQVKKISKKIKEEQEEEQEEEFKKKKQNTKTSTTDETEEKAFFQKEKIIRNGNILKIGGLTVFLDRILGHGSNGTIVFMGKFSGRKVAVKRMLKEFYSLAEREVELLCQSDNHLNVIRYFCCKEDEMFVYLALELCVMNFFEYITTNKKIEYRKNQKVDKEKEVQQNRSLLRQMGYAIRHLHDLNIVHRDLKPHNTLIVYENGTDVPMIKISDMGLSKKMEGKKTSFHNTTGKAYGSAGWSAPEMILHKKGVRKTKAVDIFSFGCTIYFVLTGGKHPFGKEHFEREQNIVNGKIDLRPLKPFPMERELIKRMVSVNPNDRPVIDEVLCHPLFWNYKRRLLYLCDVSDQLGLYYRNNGVEHEILGKIQNRFRIKDWSLKVDKKMLKELEKFRKYDHKKAWDLIRCIRNIHFHFREYSDYIQNILSPYPGGIYSYFLVKRFKYLFSDVFEFVTNEGWGENKEMFYKYYKELSEK